MDSPSTTSTTSTQMFDTIIIGAGSAGLPAGMYASRYKLSNLIIGEMPGGALATSHCVENWPGTLSATGASIMDGFRTHAESSGSRLITDRVEHVDRLGEYHFRISTLASGSFDTRTVIFATGNRYKKLGVPGEDTYLGQGVSYCATCDGNFFRGQRVAIVGGGNTAVTEALYLAEIAREVHILVRGDRLRAEDLWIDKALTHTNIIIHYSTQIREIHGSMMGVTHVECVDGTQIDLEGVFVAVGNEPSTLLIDHLGVEKDTDGTIVVDRRQETNIRGLYAAGDVTTGSNKFRQTIMSAAEGCLAAHSVHEDILKIS